MYKLITVRDRINTIADAWLNAYYIDFDNNWYSEGKENIYKILLHEKPKTTEHITEIIGNSTWTDVTCECCEENVFVVIEFEHTYDWGDGMIEKATIGRLCHNCLKTACDLISKESYNNA